MKKDILIGGAWPYANNSLHVGHLAALLPGDVIARYNRIIGNNVIYVSGTDSHGTPITQRAKRENKSPLDIVNHYHEEFLKNFNDLDFSYDLYTITETPYHKETVQEFFKLIYDNGYIYEKETDEDFCEKCNTFLSDREIIGICPYCGKEAKGDQCDNCLNALNPNELLDKHCSYCKNKTISKKNKHLYFALSKFQNKIQDLVDNNIDRWRKNATNETKKFLSLGLIDRAVTRQLDWGVDVPIKGYEDKKLYVWIEAVLGYLTATKKVCEERNIDFDTFVKKKDNFTTYFIHGKDNIIFHTVIYPSLLIAMNKDLALPDYIVSSEYVNMNGEKMSKSKGNLLTINEMLEKYNKDTIRFFMIFNGPEKKDVSFSQEEVIQTHNKFLVGVLGNFINRNLSFINKKFNGLIKKAQIDSNIQNITKNLYTEVGSLIEKAELKTALEKIIEYASLGNKYYDENEPWIKVKEDEETFNNITYTCVYMMANLSNLLNPFMPATSNKIKSILNLKELDWNEYLIDEDIKINNLKMLFDRIDI